MTNSLIDYRVIGQRVHARRREMDLTQGELAERIGVSGSFVGHIERGEKIPSLETMARLVKALNTTLDQLVFGVRVRCEGMSCPLYGEFAAILRAYGIDNKA